MLPHVALRVIRLASDPNASMQEMAKVILTDQTIATKIIQIANSALYATAVEIRSINQALVRLGQVEVKNLMLAISLQTKIFKSRLYGGLARGYWERSVGAAFAARVIASGLKADKDEAFLCGLMHNLGRMIALTVIEEAQKAVGPDFRPSQSLINAIADQYHRDVGSLTVEKWSLPPAVGETIRFYENPEERAGVARVAAVINLAEGFCRRAGIGGPAPEEIALDRLGGVRLLRAESALVQDLFARFVQVFDQAKGEFL
jgi:HD-like signal output (HDOD) protein